MKIEVGMYIRYIPTLGEYTQLISKITKKENRLLDVAYYLDNETYPVFNSHFDDVKKASYNIIDLIEVGDYVNGEKVGYIDDCVGTLRQFYFEYENLDEDTGHYYEDIKSIVTKEQFERVSYKVGD